MKWLYRIGFVFGATQVLGNLMYACPVCYGAKDSPMTAGMNTAILVMLGIVGAVLSMFVAFFIYLWRRHRKHHADLSPTAFVNEDGTIQTNNGKGVAEWNTF